MNDKHPAIIECCGCGRFRTAAPKPTPDADDSCAACVAEGAAGRLWSPEAQAYVTHDQRGTVEP